MPPFYKSIATRSREFLSLKSKKIDTTHAIMPEMRAHRTAEDTLHAHVTLENWVTQHGGRLHNDVQFSHDEQLGVHLQAKPEAVSGKVSPETCVMKIPIELTMSFFDAIDYKPEGNTSPFASHGVVLPKHLIERIGPEETTAFFLMGQYLRGEEGFWYPYIQSLPGPGELTTPLYFEDDDLVWLNMTSLAASREGRLQIWKTNYEKGYSILKESQIENAHFYSWDLYLWASTIISSRAFTAKVLASVIPKLETLDDKVSVLLPLIDATNHKPLSKVEWQAGTDSIGLAVMADVNAGDEVGNNYGPRNNEQLMMNYGFCIPNNPCEYRVVSLRAPPGSPLAQIKAQFEQHFPRPSKKNSKNDQEDRYYVFSLPYPLIDTSQPLEFSIFSPDLLHALSVISANDRELETVTIDEEGFWVPWQIYGNSRNLIAALNQIVIELLSYIQRLEVSGRQLGEPRNLKQAFAKQFRESHIRLSQTAVFIANWTTTLSQDASKADREELLNKLLSRIPQHIFDIETAEQVKKRILTRKSLLSDNQFGELLRFENLFHLLSTVMQGPSRQCIEEVSSRAKSAIAIDDGAGLSSGDAENGPHALFAYAVFICLLVAVNRHNPSQLTSRLRSWCDFLLDKYPAPPNDVAWALPDENDEAMFSTYDSFINDHLPGETISAVTTFVGTQTPAQGERDVSEWWLSPNWLRWAWLVLEQEMVTNVIDDPLGYLINGADGGMKTKNFLYVPQA